MKLFYLISILLATAAVTNTQIIGLLVAIEICIEIIEAEEVVATLTGEAEFVLTAVETEEDSILINTQMQSGWATLYEGNTNNIIASYEIQGMTGEISEDIAIGERSGVSTVLGWTQRVPVPNEEWSVSFGSLWTGNVAVNTDGSFILADAGLLGDNAVIFGAGAENIETSTQWSMDLVTQYDVVESGGGSPP